MDEYNDKNRLIVTVKDTMGHKSKFSAVDDYQVSPEGHLSIFQYFESVKESKTVCVFSKDKWICVSVTIFE